MLLSPRLNSLGYQIGGDADEAKLTIALGSDGKIRGIDEVPRGIACDCTCFECGGGLIARQGDVRVHHFAHIAGEPCDSAETQAHLFAKMVIEQALSVHLPSIETYGLINSEPQVFERVDLEPTFSDIRPDLIATSKTRQLMIEVRVTHAVDARKTGWLQRRKLSCIEIDLRKYRWKSDDDLRTAILRTAPRQWISHRNRAVPTPPPLLNSARTSKGTGSAARVPSNTAWYAAQTAKEFPDIEKSWAAARKRLGAAGTRRR